jgi:hypothetical protein
MTPIRLLATSFSLALVAAGAAGACSASDTASSQSTTTTGGSGGDGAGGTGGSVSGATGTGGEEDLFDGGLSLDGSSPDGGFSTCAKETQFIYTLSSDNMLYKFDPPTLVFTPIGKLDCNKQGASPFSMAVDRKAQAWVVFTDGTLAQVDTKTAHCTPTSFVVGQSGFTTFGMGFSSNAPGSADETLFVSDSSFNGSTLGLATIDVQTLKLTPVGKYDKITARAEMTGTGDARLFAAFEGTPYNVAEVGKTDAKVLSQAPQAAINYPAGSSNFAFAFWGGDFWLFVGPGNKTDVFQYKPATGKTDQVQTTSAVIVGAGVSTCAPTKPPA